MLELKNLQAGYGQMKVLHGVDLTISDGEIVALLGSNGAGKSTLNNNLSGIYKPTGGQILFEGQDITGMRSESVVDLGIVQVPEGRRIFPNMSIRENLELGSYRRGKKSRTENIEKVIAIFPRLKERRAQQAGTLSGGEQQMLAVGRAMMLRPRIMLLDEPSFGLAPLIVEELFNILRTINEKEKVSMLLVEQNATLALNLADHAYLLETGNVVISGTSEEIAADEGVRKSYLGY